MHLLNMPINLPVYLPADTAVVPFGDPLSDVTVTSSTTAVVNAPGYNNPQVGDIVTFSAIGAGVLPSGITAATLYYVNTIVSTAAATFSITTSKGSGTAVATTTTGSGVLTLHLMSMQPYGTKTPFKSGATVLAMNITSSATTLKGAVDTNSANYGNPEGPGTYTVISTIASGSMALVELAGYDWLISTGTLVLSLLQV